MAWLRRLIRIWLGRYDVVPLSKAYRDFIDDTEALMRRARVLGLFRTAERLHHALNEARSESFEALPHEEVMVDFVIGPIQKQHRA